MKVKLSIVKKQGDQYNQLVISSTEFEFIEHQETVVNEKTNAIDVVDDRQNRELDKIGRHKLRLTEFVLDLQELYDVKEVKQNEDTQ